MSKLDRVAKRVQAIYNATPCILLEQFDKQKGICDLCGRRIEKGHAVLDHSVPVSHFAFGRLPIKEAIRKANAPGNLRAVHRVCNSLKGILTRKWWYQAGLNKHPYPVNPIIRQLDPVWREMMRWNCTPYAAFGNTSVPNPPKK